MSVKEKDRDYKKYFYGQDGIPVKRMPASEATILGLIPIIIFIIIYVIYSNGNYENYYNDYEKSSCHICE